MKKTNVSLRKFLTVSRYVLLGMLAGSCRERPLDPVITSLHFDVVSGNNQTGAPNTELPQPLVVRAVNPSGAPIAGIVVNFVVVAGNGKIFAGSSLTNSQGVAQDYWTLGPTIGAPQQVEVRAVDPTTGQKHVFAVFNATVAAARSPNRLVIQSGNSQSTYPHTALPRELVVFVGDGAGGIANVAVTWSVSAGGGQVTPASAFTDANGIARAQWTLGNAGNQEVLVRADTMTRAFSAYAMNPASVDLYPNAPVLIAGREPTAISTRVKTADGSELSHLHFRVSYSVSDTGVVRVSTTEPIFQSDGSGLYRQFLMVTPIRAGQVVVRVTAGTVSDTMTVTVVSHQMSYISAGSWNSCGIERQAVYCWGRNAEGQGSPEGRPMIAPAAAHATVYPHTIAAGGYHVCGLYMSSVANLARCWGLNANGQHGNGTTAPTSAATVGKAFSNLTAGEYHTCGVAVDDGRTYCWGRNVEGQLGIGTNSPMVTSPVSLGDAYQFATLDGGVSHTCGITTAGDAYCWGEGTAGQLGNSTRSSSNVPVAVLGGLKFTKIAADYYHTCAITTTGLAYCWGANFYGQLGNGENGPNVIAVQPSAVVGGIVFESVTAGYEFTCGISTSGSAYCWGRSDYGQLGRGAVATECNGGFEGTRACAVTPGIISQGSSFRFLSISAGWSHACATIVGGSSMCWGLNQYGQLGIGLGSDGRPRAPERCGPDLIACSRVPMTTLGSETLPGVLSLRR